MNRMILMFAVLMLAACSQPPPEPVMETDMDRLAGVWVLDSSEVMIVAPSMDDFALNIAGMDIPMRALEDPAPHDTITNAAINNGEMGYVWTFAVIGDSVVVTMDNGEQLFGKKIRALTGDDLYALDKARHPNVIEGG